MTAISWKYNTDGLWSNAGNWNGGVLPGAADDVTLSTPSSHTITYASATTTIHSLTATTDSLAITGGTLGILAGASFGQTLTTSGGTLALLGPTASVAGTFNGIGGEITLATGTRLTVSGAAIFDSDTQGITGADLDGAGTLSTLGTTTVEQGLYGEYSALILGGGITWDIGANVLDAGQIVTGDASGLTASIMNAAGLNFDLTTDTSSILNGRATGSQGQTVYGSSTFSNAGTFAKTGGTLTSTVDSLFTNTGLITVASGTLEFDGGGNFAGTLGGAGQIAFGGASFATLTLGSTALSVAQLLVDGAAVTLKDRLSFAGSVTMSSGTLSLAAGSNTVGSYTQDGYYYAHLYLDGGNFTVANGYFGSGYVEGAGTLTTSGTTTVSGWNTYSFYAGGNLSWVNTGTLNQAFYFYVDFGSGGGFSFTNDAGATYNMTGDFSLGANSGNGIGSSFVNDGTFAKTVGVGVNEVYSAFTNAGTIDAATGTIEFDGGGVFGGSLVGTGTVSFASGNATLSSGISVQVDTLLLDGATVSESGNLTLDAPEFLQTGGRLLIGANTLTVANGDFGTGYLDGTGTLSTSGTTNFSGFNGGVMELGGGLDWTNTGTVDLNYYVYVDYPSGSGFSITNAAGANFNLLGNFDVGGNNAYGTSSSFSNLGTLTKTGGTGVTNFVSLFNNTGTIDAATGTIEFDSGGSFAGTLSGAGTVSFAGGTATLASSLVVSAGTLLIDGGTLALGSNLTLSATAFALTAGQLNLDGDKLTVKNADFGGGYIVGPGSIFTSGTTTIGNTSSLTLGGGFSWTNTGTITQDYYIYDYYQLGSGFTLTNASGATYDVAGDVQIGGNNVNGASSTFTNQGIFAKTGGTNVTTVTSVFTNTGTINAQTATIAFNGGGTFGGSITGTGAVSLNNASFTLSGLSTTGTSNLYFYYSSITATGKNTIAGLLSTQSSSLTLSAGSTVTVSGVFDVNVPGQGIPLDGPGTLVTTGATNIIDWYNNGVMLSVGGGSTWVNSGTVTAGGIVEIGDRDFLNGTAAGTLTNTAGAIFDFTDDDAAIFQSAYYNGYGNLVSSGGLVTNQGLVEKTGGTAISAIDALFDSTGTLATSSGTIGLYGGGAISGVIADGSNILFGAGLFTDAALTIGGGDLVSNAATILATGNLTLGDSSTSAAVFTNSGTYVLDGNVNITAAGTAGSYISNTGTLEKTAGTGESVISAPIINSGTIIAEIGTLVLTGSITGTGALIIDAGTVLELGAATAASQTISFTAPSETLLLEHASTMLGTISGLTVGDAIDLAGITATKASVNASDVLQVFDNTTLVASLQLTGSYLSDTFGVTSTSAGSTVTLTDAVSNYKGVNGDWYSTNVWTNGPPTAQTNASVSLAGTYTLTLNGGETAAVNTLALKAANGTYAFSGTLDVTTSVTVSAGALQLTGVIDGGILDNAGGGSITFGNNSVLDSVAYQGTLDLSENYANVVIENGGSLAGAGGKGAATINLTGYQAYLYAEGDETLNNATVNFGGTNGTSYVRSYDPTNQGAILTLGSSLVLMQTGLNVALQDSGNAYDAVYNEGTIKASVSGGTFTVSGNDFENDGTIAVSGGDTFAIQSAQFVNTKTLTVSGSTLGISGTYQNTGSVTATNSVLDFATSLTGAQLTAIVVGGGDTLNLSGTLTENGTLLVGTGQKIIALNLSGEIADATITPTAGAFTFLNGSILDNDTFNGTMSVGSGVAVTLDGTIQNAVIADSGGGILFDPGVELEKVTYQGTMTLQPGNTVEIAGGIKLTGPGGTGAGTIDAVAGATMSVLYFLDSETLSNVTIDSGASGTGTQGVYLAPVVAAGGSLTLASTATFSVTADTSAGFFSISPTTGMPLKNTIINDGLIAIGAGATFLGADGSVANFTNNGAITLGQSAAWITSAGSLTTALFTNAKAGTISLGADATFETNGGGMSNAGSIGLSAGAVLTVQGAFAQTGTATVAAGASFDIDGATTLAALAGISGAGTLGIDGLLNLANGTFDMAASGRITNVQIGGEIEAGTFSNDAGTVTFGTLATLSAMIWKGALDIGGGSTVEVLKSLKVETTAGALPGAINLTGGATAGAALDYVATTLIDEVTLTSASPSASTASPGLANLLEIGTAGGTLTFGAHFVLDATSGATELADSASSTAGGSLVNEGHINVTGGALWLDPSISSFTNTAFITLSTNTEFDPTPGSMGATNFTNSGTVDLVSLDDFDISANGTNSGLITIGTGSEVTFGGNFTNTGSITLANGGSLTVGGTMTNTGHITASGATSDFVAAEAGAGSAFSAGTLTGGIWSVSASSTLTLEFGANVTTDAADISLSGTGSVLRSVGATIERLESSLATIAATGTLALLANRGYVTTLALTDDGKLQLQGGTLSAGGLTVAAGGLLTGSGTVITAISNAGTLDASGGTLTLSGAATGTGGLQIEASSTLELGAANAETVLFKGASAELKLDSPASFTGTLSGFAATDSLLLESTTATAAVLSGNKLTVTLSGGTTEVFAVAGNSATVTLTVAESGGNALITYPGAQAKGGPTGQAAPEMRFLAKPADTSGHSPPDVTIAHGLADFAAGEKFAPAAPETGGLAPDARGTPDWLGAAWYNHPFGAAEPHAAVMISGRE
jgi:hypothetical protein